MKPIEYLVLKASKLLFKNLVGFMAADPNQNSKRIVSELENTVKMIEEDESCLTKDKMKRFKKNLMKISEYEDDKVFPTEGVIFMYTNPKGITNAKTAAAAAAIETYFQFTLLSLCALDEFLL